MTVAREQKPPFKILVFPCGAENALELHDALAYCVNIEVWGASGQADHGEHVFRNYIGDVPYIQEPQFIAAFNEILKSRQIDLVFPTHDTVAEFFAHHRSEIACRIVMADDETAKICREKRRIYERFADRAFAPRVYGNPAAVDAFPVFAKPNIGEGGRHTLTIQTREECVRALADRPDLLLVEFLPGEEYTVDCFTDRHGVLRFVGPRERSRILAGISVHARSAPLTPEIDEIAAEINRSLHFRGLWFFQLKRSGNGGLKLMEISTRAAGTMCLYRHQGVNLPLLSVYDAMEMDVEILQNEFPVEVDRALFNCFRIGFEFDTIYLDFDDTLICRGEVNRYVLLLLYQAASKGKTVHLLTRHEGDILRALADARLDPNLFTQIHALDWTEEKHELIRRGERAVFIDNAFAERKKVKEHTGIPVFDVDGVQALLDWRI